MRKSSTILAQLKANPEYTASDTEKKAERFKDNDGTGIPPPIFYIRKLRNRLSNSLKKGSQSMGTTQYLGKMKYLKDKHGLYTGQTDNVQDRKDVQDNPIFLALDKVNIRHELSVDSGPRSRGVSRASPGSQKSSNTFRQSEKEKTIGEKDVVRVLRDGLSPVRTPSIQEWNNHKQVRGDSKRKPIFIPF